MKTQAHPHPEESGVRTPVWGVWQPVTVHPSCTGFADPWTLKNGTAAGEGKHSDIVVANRHRRCSLQLVIFSKDWAFAGRCSACLSRHRHDLHLGFAMCGRNELMNTLFSDLYFYSVQSQKEKKKRRYVPASRVISNCHSLGFQYFAQPTGSHVPQALPRGRRISTMSHRLNIRCCRHTHARSDGGNN